MSPNKTLRAAFRQATGRKVRLRDVAFRQLVRANFTGGEQLDLLIAISSIIDHGCNEREYDESKAEICDQEQDRDTWWLVLVPDGEASRATVVWTGQDEAWAWINETYDLDGDGVQAFTWGLRNNPNEEGLESSSEIRDGQIRTRCVW